MGDRSSRRRVVFPILIAAAFVLLQTAGRSQDRSVRPRAAEGASGAQAAVGAGGDERTLRGLAAELRRSRAAGDLVRAATIFAQMFRVEATPDPGATAKIEAAAPTCGVAAKPAASKGAPDGGPSVPVFNSAEDERNPAAEVRRATDGGGVLFSAAELWSGGLPRDIGIRQSPDGGRTWTGLASLGDGHPRTRPALRQITGEAMGLVFAREWSAGDSDIIFARLAPDLSGGAEFPVALSGADQRNPSLAADHPAFASPYVYAIYAEREGLTQSVRFRVSPDLGASWSEAVTIASRTGAGLPEIETALAYDPGKNALWAAFTWPRSGSTGIAVAVSRTFGASWSPPVFVTSVEDETDGAPRIAAYRGTAVVAFERKAPGGGFDIGLAASTSGGRNWTATGLASTAADERYPDVRVIEDAAGGRFWASYVEANAMVHILSRDATGSWTTEATFETGASPVASGPVDVVPMRSAAGQAPEAGVFWTSNGPDADILFAAAGPLALADLVVTPGSQAVPSAAGTTSFSVSKSGEGRVDWTAAVVTGSDWLSIQSGESGTNAGTIVAAFMDNAGPDPRTGSIRVTATDQAIPSVTVTVVQAGAPRLEVMPAEGLTATGLVGGPFAPAHQAYTLRNEGTAAIDWAAAKTEAWLSLSGASGTLAPGASTTVTVSFNAAADGLASGTYGDTVTFTNTTNGLGSTTRPVSLTVTEPPGILSVTPAEGLAATGLIGGPFTPSSQTYTLRNAGAAPLDWTAARTEGWTSLSATAGTLAPGDSATVTVSINTAAEALPAGSYNDTVSFANTTNGLGGTTRSVGLTVTAPPGVLSVAPAEGLVSSGLVGGPFTPASRVYTLQNTGATALDWTASRTRSWTSLSTPSGTLAPGDSATVTVSINAAANALAAGIYTDTVAFANATTGHGSTTRPVELTITAPGVLTVTPSEGLDATGLVGGPFTPSSRTYTLHNAGGVPLDWTAARTRPWTSLSAAAGTLAAGEATTVTVSINAAADALAAGVYGDTVSFTNATDGSGSTTRPVGLTVTSPPGVLAVTPGEGLAAAGPEGGPFTPSSRVYTLQNPGGSSLDWTASKLRSWTSLSAAAGTLAAGDATTVTVSINASAGSLVSGAYADTIGFVNATTGNGSTTRPVTLTVTSGPALSVTPSHRDLPFTGGATTFDVANVGGGTMVWTAAVISGSDWLGISAGSGGTDAGTIAVVAAANRTSLDRTGTIRVTAAGAAGSPKDVTVSQVRGSLALTLSGQRLMEKAWIIERTFGRLTVVIDNPAAVPVEAYILYRRSGGGGDQIVQQIDGGAVSGSPLVINDAFLEPGTSYTYRVAAVDAFGGTLAVSNEITI